MGLLVPFQESARGARWSREKFPEKVRHFKSFGILPAEAHRPKFGHLLPEMGGSLANTLSTPRLRRFSRAVAQLFGHVDAGKLRSLSIIDDHAAG